MSVTPNVIGRYNVVFASNFSVTGNNNDIVFALYNNGTLITDATVTYTQVDNSGNLSQCCYIAVTTNWTTGAFQAYWYMGAGTSTVTLPNYRRIAAFWLS